VNAQNGGDFGLPQRRHPSHGVLDSSGMPTIVFLTVCTEDRIPRLANDAVHNRLRSIWLGATA
jgi:hypothetical protein